MIITKFCGYQPRFISDSEVEVDFENLDCGQTQIFLLEVEKNGIENSAVSTSLTYVKNDKIKTSDSKKNYHSSAESTEKELKKNYQIAKMTSELKQAAKDFSENNVGNAQTKIQNIIDYFNNFSDKSDEDLKRIYDIALQYSLKKQNANFIIKV